MVTRSRAASCIVFRTQVPETLLWQKISLEHLTALRMSLHSSTESISECLTGIAFDTPLYHRVPMNMEALNALKKALGRGHQIRDYRESSIAPWPHL